MRNTADTKPEVVMSYVLQQTEQIEMRFQRLHVFEVNYADGTDSDTRRHPPTTEMQDGGHQTGNTSI